MNQKTIRAMQVESDRRCTASQLKQILAATPITIITER